MHKTRSHILLTKTVFSLSRSGRLSICSRASYLFLCPIKSSAGIRQCIGIPVFRFETCPLLQILSPTPVSFFTATANNRCHFILNSKKIYVQCLVKAQYILQFRFQPDNQRVFHFNANVLVLTY